MVALSEVRDLLIAPFYEGDSHGSLDLALDPLSPQPGEPADAGVAVGGDALRQALLVRLLTPLGSLAELGHPEFGSRLSELIGEANTAQTRQLARAYVLAAVRMDPRIAGVLELEVAEPDQLSLERLHISLLVEPVLGGDPIALGIEVTL